MRAFFFIRSLSNRELASVPRSLIGQLHSLAGDSRTPDTVQGHVGRGPASRVLHRPSLTSTMHSVVPCFAPAYYVNATLNLFLLLIIPTNQYLLIPGIRTPENSNDPIARYIALRLWETAGLAIRVIADSHRSTRLQHYYPAPRGGH